MKNLQGQFEGMVDPIHIPFLIKRMPKRQEYLGNYEQDVIIFNKFKNKLSNTFKFDDNSKAQIEKMRAAYFCTYFDLEGDKDTFSRFRPVSPPEEVFLIINQILVTAYGKLTKDSKLFRYDIRPPANTGYPWYLSGKMQHGVRLLNYLLGSLSMLGENAILDYMVWLKNKSNVPNFILFNSRFQDASSSKIIPIVRGDIEVMPNDVHLSKRNRAINLASKVSYALAMQPIKLLQKTMYETPLSGNQQDQMRREIAERVMKRKDATIFSDYSKFDYHMAGDINNIINRVKVDFIKKVHPEWEGRITSYLKFHDEEVRYVYPFFGQFIKMKTEHHFGSGRRDTSVHGTLANMFFFVHFLFKVLGSQEMVLKEVYSNENYFRCFSDDMVWIPSNSMIARFRTFDNLKNEFYSFIKATYFIEAKDEEPKKYLGNIYEPSSPFLGNVDPYAIVRKTFSPERRKIPLLMNIGMLARRMMLRDIFGIKEGDSHFRKLVKIIEEDGIFGYNSSGKLSFEPQRIDDIVMSPNPIEAMKTLSIKASSYDILASEYNEVLYVIAQIGDIDMDFDDSFQDVEDRVFSVEEVGAQLKDYVHLATQQVLDSAKDFRYNANNVTLKRAVTDLIKYESVKKSNAALEILKSLTPILL